MFTDVHNVACLLHQPSVIAVLCLLSGRSSPARASGVLVSRARLLSDLCLPPLITECPEGTIGHTVLSVSWQPWTSNRQTACARLSNAAPASLVSFLSQEARR